MGSRPSWVARTNTLPDMPVYTLSCHRRLTDTRALAQDNSTLDRPLPCGCTSQEMVTACTWSRSKMVQCFSSTKKTDRGGGRNTWIGSLHCPPYTHRHERHSVHCPNIGWHNDVQQVVGKVDLHVQLRMGFFASNISTYVRTSSQNNVDLAYIINDIALLYMLARYFRFHEWRKSKLVGIVTCCLNDATLTLWLVHSLFLQVLENVAKHAPNHL